MSTAHIIRDLVTAQHRLHRHESFIPSVLVELARRRADIGAIMHEVERMGSGGYADPTAVTAVRVDIDSQAQRIREAVILICRAIDHLDAMCRKALGERRAAEEAPRCPGYPEGVDCIDITAHHLDTKTLAPMLRPDRLCDRHGFEADRDSRARIRAHNERMRRHNPRAYRE